MCRMNEKSVVRILCCLGTTMGLLGCDRVVGEPGGEAPEYRTAEVLPEGRADDDDRGAAMARADAQVEVLDGLSETLVDAVDATGDCDAADSLESCTRDSPDFGETRELCEPGSVLCTEGKVFLCDGDGASWNMIEECQVDEVCFGEACCQPSCLDRECGGDGCGGLCGLCAPGSHCDEGGYCQCEPACEVGECGEDGCSGSCGECDPGYACVEGLCTCQPACVGKECGEDDCGGVCGQCLDTHACNDGKCEPICIPEECDGVDNDCDGDVDEGFLDSDVDGTTDCVDSDDDNDAFPDEADCDPLDPMVHPGVAESCDGIDNDCDGLTDGALADALCSDDDSCTIDVCDVALGGCRYLPTCADCLGHVPPGAIVITEIMTTSKTAELVSAWNIPDSSQLEWLEVENVCDAPLDLALMTLKGEATGSGAIGECGPVVLHPGKRLVLGRDMSIQVGPPVQPNPQPTSRLVPYSGVILRKDTGVSLVAFDGTVVDHVPYGSQGFPNALGRSISLSLGATDDVDNDLAENWCLGMAKCLPYEMDHGTPGQQNPECYVAGSCGNSVVEAGEECDAGPLNGQFKECRKDCQSWEWCGNGWQDWGEACDPVDLWEDKACGPYCGLAMCTCLRPGCGNGTVEGSFLWQGAKWTEPEDCDDGNNLYGDGCSGMCNYEYAPSAYPLSPCGDGVVGPHEICDDGNLEAGDGCGPDCKWECDGPYSFGQVIFSEFLWQPAVLPGLEAAWFELYNTGNSDVDLTGWFFSSGPTVPGQKPIRFQEGCNLQLKAGQYMVIAWSDAALPDYGVDVKCVIDAGFSHKGTLRSPDGKIIDGVWSLPYPSKGYSWSLDPSALDYMSNDLKENWCKGSVPIGNGDFGTPGQPNTPCP